MRTFKELKRELDQNGHLDINNVSGIYKIYLPKDFEIIIRPNTDAIEEYNGRSMLYSVEELRDKYLHISAARNDDKYLIYIGKAGQSIGRGLQKRIEEFVKYGYGLCNNHRGGRAIWQLENNKKLLLEYFECDNPLQIEKEQLKKYKVENKTYPFANWRS